MQPVHGHPSWVIPVRHKQEPTGSEDIGHKMTAHSKGKKTLEKGLGTINPPEK